jgi:excisionase family DNA binding protein
MSQIKIESPFFSLSSAADYLHLKKSTLYSYTHKRVIPFYKLRGRKIYFRKEDLDNFITGENDSNLVKSQKQIESEAIANLISKK